MTDIATILLVGATGMIGAAIVDQAGGARPGLHCLARRPLAHSAIPTTIAPPADWPAVIARLAPATLICALGTTRAQAGSDAAFRAVDHDLVIAVAQAAHVAGTRHMIGVSSVGASAASRSLYLRTKGEVEQRLSSIGFDRLDLIRPGLLVGDRTGPRRTGEALAMTLGPVTDRLLHGGLRRYRSIAATTVARSIWTLCAVDDRGRDLLKVHGTFIHYHDDIVRLAQLSRTQSQPDRFIR